MGMKTSMVSDIFKGVHRDPLGLLWPFLRPPQGVNLGKSGDWVDCPHRDLLGLLGPS